MADSKPYGNVAYADSKNGKYPIDTKAHAKAAWSYINMPKNAAKYPLNGVALSSVKARIMAACKKFGIETSQGNSAPPDGEYRTVYATARHLARLAPFRTVPDLLDFANNKRIRRLSPEVVEGGSGLHVFIRPDLADDW